MLHGEKICCAILAGGKSERLLEKPFLMLNGKMLVSYAIDSAAEYFEEVLVIAKKEQRNKLENAIRIVKQARIICDNSTEFSPWNGIRTAVENTKAEWIFLLACDMPFINVKLFDLLASKINPDIDCIIPKTDRLQPLCALYRRSALKGCWMHRNPQEVSIFEGSVTRFAESLRKEVVQIKEKNAFWLFNINAKEDFEKAKDVKNNTTDRYLKI